MLMESPSDDARAQPSSAAGIDHKETSGGNKVTERAIPPIGGKTPLESAMAAANTYVEMLHKKLQPFLTNLIRQVLKDMSSFHYKSEKLEEMNATSDYVPAVCRTVGMKLQAVSEVTKRAWALKLLKTNSLRLSRQHDANGQRALSSLSLT
jgi:hypothetical protein